MSSNVPSRPIIQRTDIIRSITLREAAHGASCVACGANDGTTVLAHLPNVGGGGKGIKCDDIWGAHLCRACHELADGLYRREYEWRSRMILATQRRLVHNGVLLVPA